ncbi:hypothetical protein P43SY_004182 [Pythium insidiosum]|uniref:Uncharacterized protein n=1 Tax=Pythium insidiosum TaxID=114742 RepID=A0AAD5Q219_PYTIN|nr:hypothetical protein P43SY_004182 [Pythium insidiosum]
MTRRGGSTAKVAAATMTMTMTATALTTATVSSSSLSAASELTSKELLRKHRLLRRASGYLLAKKYRSTWPTAADGAGGAARDRSSRRAPFKAARRSAGGPHAVAPPPSGAGGPRGSLAALSAAVASTKSYTLEELINFWKDLPPVAKRALLRIHRDVYLAALDRYLVRHNLCCECHDNVIAEWEDHERRRAGTRSLQDVFSVFPPFLDDEEDDDYDDDEEEDDEDDEEDEEEEDYDDYDDSEAPMEVDGARGRHPELLLDGDDVLLDDEELLFKYELDGGDGAIRRPTRGPDGLLSDEYLAALDVHKRQEDELLRLIQKEERYIIIREDHHEFIMDLIRCGEEYSHIASLPPGYGDSEADEDAAADDEDDDDDDDDAECPGANTSLLAQEYLLDVLAIKFREQLENAYQAALQHSLAVQAELLRDEIADLQRASQKPPATTSSKSKKKKDKRKKKKKSDNNNGKTSSSASKQSSPSTTTTTMARTRRGSPGTSNNNQSESDSNESATDKTSRGNNRKLARAAAPRSNQDDSDENTPPSDPNQRRWHDSSNTDAFFLDGYDDQDMTDHDDDVDREVEAFRQLLEQIHTQRTPTPKPKLVLPPGAFSMM